MGEAFGLLLELRGEQARLDGIMIEGLFEASASSFRLVAGVLSSWETLATKSRRILLTLWSSSGRDVRRSVSPASSSTPDVLLTAGSPGFGSKR